MILNPDLHNLSYKPIILEKLLSCVEELNKFEFEMHPEADIVFRAIANAAIIIIKREMGIDTGEKELISAMRILLDKKGNKMLSIGLAVVLMICVWVKVWFLKVYFSSLCKFLVNQLRKKF
jgi:hypothetical protein